MSSDVSQDAPETTGNGPTNLVAGSLLSLSKDNRYVERCQSLLLDVLEPAIGSNNFSESVKTGTWYAAYLLYLHLVVSRTGRSLGMEAAGLRFVDTSDRKKLMISLWVLGLSSFFLDYFATRTDFPDSMAREALRGTDRRRIHHEMRQQMLQRSTLLTRESERHDIDQLDSQRRQVSISLIRITNAILKSILGPSAHFEGPHAVHANQSTNTAFSTLSWLIRLHVAQYCITGKHPSLLHRMLGLRHEQAESRIKHGTSTFRFVGFVIGIQAAALITRNTANWLAQKIARLLNASSNNNIRARSLRKLFPNDSTSPSAKYNNFCAICRAERVDSAAPQACGHVFCWNCLIQWVTTIRPECPLCRARCRPQDILPLYNYATKHKTEI